MNAACANVLQRVLRPAAAVAVTAVAGCSITGLGGSDEYACKAPDGVRCDSVSGTYANAVQNHLPAQRRPSSARSAATMPTPETIEPALPVTTRAASEPRKSPDTSQPLRSEPRILRLWFKAYLDSDQDLNDQGHVYVQVDTGRWLIEQTQRQTRNAFAPVRPPRAVSSSQADEGRSVPARASTVTTEPFRPAGALPAMPRTASPTKPEERP